MKVHSFYVDEAEKHGVDKAVILYNLRFWLEKNKANGKNIYEGYYWTYNSAEAFTELFPYFSKHKINRLLKQLEKDGYLISGCFNKKGYDRTKWYTLPEFSVEQPSKPDDKPFCKNAKCNLQNCEMDVAEMQDGFCKNATPIPDSKPNGNPDSKPDNGGDEKKEPSKDDLLANEIFDFWLEVSGQRIKKTDKRISHIKARLKDGYSKEDVTDAMRFVATDQWHVENGHNTIELAIRSTDQLEKKLIKAQAQKNKPKVNRANDKLAVNSNWEQAAQPTETKSNMTYEELMESMQ